MDWQFTVGIGAAIAALFLPYFVKNMPVAISFTGFSVGLLFVLWGFLPSHSKIPVLPTVAVIMCLSGLIGSATWWVDARTPLTTFDIVASAAPVPVNRLRASVLFDRPFSWRGKDARLEINIINEMDKPAIIRGIYLLQRFFNDPGFRGSEKYTVLGYRDQTVPPSFLLRANLGENVRLGDGSFVSIWKANYSLVNGTLSESNYVSVAAAGTARVLSTFPTVDLNQNFNISTFTPVFNIIKDDGVSAWFACRGTSLASADPKDGGGLFSDSFEHNYTLLPEAIDKNCFLIGS